MLYLNSLITIGKYLSPSQRDEVLKEIEANLYDYLEENFGEKEYTDIEIEQAMKSMGHPKKVAEAYMNSPRSLIGNAYIDSYWLVVKIAVIGVAIGLTVSNIVSFTEAENGMQFFLKLFTQIWQSGLSVIGMVTLIFAAINYYSPQESNTSDEKWSLSDLETAPEPNEKISITELIINSFFICIRLVVLNQLSLLSNVESLGITVIPIINMLHLAPFIPWINAFLGAWLALNIYLLIKSRWQKQTRVLCILLDILGIVLLLIIAQTPGIFDLSSISDTLNSEFNLYQWAQSTGYIFIAVFIAISGFEIYKHLKILLKDRKA